MFVDFSVCIIIFPSFLSQRVGCIKLALCEHSSFFVRIYLFKVLGSILQTYIQSIETQILSKIRVVLYFTQSEAELVQSPRIGD